MNTFLKHAASVVITLSLIPLAFWLYILVSHLLGIVGPRPFSVEALFLGVFPWAVLWIIGYKLDGRMPWQILKKSE